MLANISLRKLFMDSVKSRLIYLFYFLLAISIFIVLAQPLNLYPISVSQSFTPDEGYGIVNYTKGGQNATINFTLVMSDWGDLDGNVTEITFEMPDNVIFSDMENVSNGTGLNTSLGDDWWCDSSTAGLDYYLNWSCYNATESQLGSNDMIDIWFNFTANSTGTEEVVEWSIIIVGNSTDQDANTTLWYTNIDDLEPRITLDSPVDIYNTTEKVTFNYTATDPNLDTCELWGNWTTGWHLNETFLGLTSDVTNGSSNISIEDGRYVWSVYCNDTFANSNTTVNNLTFVVDTTPPTVTIVSPHQDGSYDMVVPLEISYSDILVGVDTVWYEVLVSQSGNSKVVNTTFTENTTLQDLDADNYDLHVYANDSLNNVQAVAKMDFKLIESSTGEGAGGGGGGGASPEEELPEVIPEILLHDVSDVEVEFGIDMRWGELLDMIDFSDYYRKTKPIFMWSLLSLLIAFTAIDFKKGKFKFWGGLLSLGFLVFVIFDYNSILSAFGSFTRMIGARFTEEGNTLLNGLIALGVILVLAYITFKDYIKKGVKRWF